jgi:hypothetical protein
MVKGAMSAQLPSDRGFERNFFRSAFFSILCFAFDLPERDLE